MTSDTWEASSGLVNRAPHSGDTPSHVRRMSRSYRYTPQQVVGIHCMSAWRVARVARRVSDCSTRVANCSKLVNRCSRHVARAQSSVMRVEARRKIAQACGLLLVVGLDRLWINIRLVHFFLKHKLYYADFNITRDTRVRISPCFGYSPREIAFDW